MFFKGFVRASLGLLEGIFSVSFGLLEGLLRVIRAAQSENKLPHEAKPNLRPQGAEIYAP